MKRFIFLLLIAICLNIHANSQVSQLNGLWNCSSGKQFYIEANNAGFLYKLVTNNGIFQATYIGLYNGIPSYRSNFPDGSFNLFLVKSVNEITMASSYNPNVMYTWTKQISNSFQSDDNNSKQYRQAQQRVVDLVPGAGYTAKKYFLNSQKKLVKSRLETAERNYKAAPTSSQTTYQWEIDRLTKEINDIDMKLLDLEQMKLRREIQ